MAFMKRLLISAVLIVFTGAQSFAQATPPTSSGTAIGQEKGKSGLSGPRKQLATIVFAGLGGAILGLSTLSFYGRPQDKLSNIAIGFAFGVIGGTALVTYKAATNPSELYGRQIEIEKATQLTSALPSEPAPVTLPLAWRFNWSF